MAIRVLIVDDSATYRTVIARSLRQIADIRVIGKAANGLQALAFLERHDVDLVILDVQMPEMGGLETLKAIRNLGIRTSVIMLSGMSQVARDLTIECLGLGALDFVQKPDSNDLQKNQIELKETFQKIISFKNLDSGEDEQVVPPPSKSKQSEPAPSPVQFRGEERLGCPDLLMIGISTGGPKALMQILAKIRADLSYPILIVQHMPPDFTKTLAAHLSKRAQVMVHEAKNNDIVEAGNIYLAPGGLHMELQKTDRWRIVLNQKAPVNSCRPSVDRLFMSAANMMSSERVVALILTGMGRDGADGAKALWKKGAFIGIQSQSSCTVYGMPKSVADQGTFHRIFDLEQVSDFINSLI